jgi:predicted small secreted protein
MKLILLCCVALLGTLGLSACSTVRGFGQDIEKSGKALQRASDHTAKNMSRSSNSSRSRPAPAKDSYARKERAYGKI